jgi:hypothetical protein
MPIMKRFVASLRNGPAIGVLRDDLLGKCNFLASRRGRYTPKSDRLLHRRNMSLWATFDHVAPQREYLPSVLCAILGADL